MEGYKHDPSYDSGYLEVSDIHRLHYEQYGKEDGKPVVFLHGGPGGQTSYANTIFFDPSFYRVVLFDQRGSGKSEPAAELRENTSQHLVEDIEKLRRHLRIDKWFMVFGGSWGSTLALLYVQAHPESVGSLVIRGIFTVRKEETMFTRGFDGAARIYPELWDEYISFLPPKDQSNPYPAYHRLLTSDDYATRLGAAKAWNKWEVGISKLIPDEADFEQLKDDTW
jgi:proline iminopeptidase